MDVKRIVKLDEKTASKIAAGEVVERPAMVVKELVENAIDAEATEITVEIKKGGKAYIKVTDNGKGIHYEDLNLVFERHATSKIRKIEDLYQTHSLGFRGEALASICAVSNLELITMRADEKLGMKVIAAGGTIHKISEVGTVKGTTLLIRDLFYNTPARLKFLKSDQAEGRSITELMSYLALSHPEIAFKYTVDDKLVFHTPGKGSLSNTIFSVFDATLLKGLYEVREEQGGIKLSGFISRFEYTKGNSSYQLCFVNGRYVKSDVVKEAIQLAYKPYMMHNRYPVCILFIELPPTEIDVNIHPAKTEIKFHDEGALKQLIFSTLKKSFNLYDQVPQVTFTEKEVFSIKTEPDRETKETLSDVFTVAKKDVYSVYHEKEKPSVAVESSMKQDASMKQDESMKQDASMKQDYQNNQDYEMPPVIQDRPKSYDFVKKPDISFDQVDFSSLTQFAEEISIETPSRLIEASVYDGLVYIGTFNKTYLLYEKDQQLYLIDQHAAHEKILYEAFMRSYAKQNIESQLLMLPEVIELTPIEMSYFEELEPVASQMGFKIEVFGDGSIVIREIPSMFDLRNAREMIHSLFENAKGDMDAKEHLKLAEKACKAAIKAHDDMSFDEQNALLESLKGLESPYTCPHGRPIIISFSLGELERKFKRVI